jgi:hypothetical protein
MGRPRHRHHVASEWRQAPIVSSKDAAGVAFKDAECFNVIATSSPASLCIPAKAGSSNDSSDSCLSAGQATSLTLLAIDIKCGRSRITENIHHRFTRTIGQGAAEYRS